MRNDLREDDSPIVPLTQEEGERTDAVVQVGFDSKGQWRGYGFVQKTLAKTGDREDNGRVGVGGSYRLNDRLLVDGEVSDGDLGPAVRLGTSFQEIRADQSLPELRARERARRTTAWTRAAAT